jgi:magnesium transporter
MADAESLTHAFLRSHVAQAGRVLEAVPAAQAAALFARAPARLGAPVLAAMLPGAAARCIEALEDERAMELLGGMAAQPLVAVLRQLPEPRRSRLMAGLPTAAGLASKLLLGFAEDTVGACTDSDVIALAPETPARDALERVRRAEASVLRVFVVASEQRLRGWVPLAALLRAPEAARLESLMSRPEAMLPASAPLRGALAHPAWERAAALPVVGAGNRLIGVLTRDALTRALRAAAPPGRAAAGDSLAGILALGYWEMLSAIVEAASTLLPRVRPLEEFGHER